MRKSIKRRALPMSSPTKGRALRALLSACASQSPTRTQHAAALLVGRVLLRLLPGLASLCHDAPHRRQSLCATLLSSHTAHRRGMLVVRRCIRVAGFERSVSNAPERSRLDGMGRRCGAHGARATSRAQSRVLDRARHCQSHHAARQLRHRNGQRHAVCDRQCASPSRSMRFDVA